MENEVISKQIIQIKDRRTITLDAIKKVDSFDKNEFLLNSELGYIHIKGKDLSIGNMDMDKGTIVVNGIIDSVSYVNQAKGTKKENFFTKLFK